MTEKKKEKEKKGLRLRLAAFLAGPDHHIARNPRRGATLATAAPIEAVQEQTEVAEFVVWGVKEQA